MLENFMPDEEIKLPIGGKNIKKGEVEKTSKSPWKMDVKDIVYFILVVLFIGFTASFISVWQMVRESIHEKKTSYDYLVQKVNDLEIRLIQKCNINDKR